MQSKHKISKVARNFLGVLLGFVNFTYKKTVRAVVAYAPPEVVDREAKGTILLDFLREYTVLIIFVSLFAIIGLISVVRMFLLKILEKRKKGNDQLQKPVEELDRSNKC